MTCNAASQGVAKQVILLVHEFAVHPRADRVQVEFKRRLESIAVVFRSSRRSHPQHVNADDRKVISQVGEHLYENGSSASESVDHYKFGKSLCGRLDSDLVDEVLAVGTAV